MDVALRQTLRAGILIRYILQIIAVIYPLSIAVSASNDGCLIFIAQDNEPGREISLNFSEALDGQNICHTIDFFPAKRADILFQDSKYSGFVGRVGEFLKKSPVAVFHIEPSVIQATGVIVSRSDKIKSVKDLAGSSIGIIRGWLWMEKLTAGHRYTVKASDIIGLAEMFHSGNVDTILMPKEALYAFGLQNYAHSVVADLKIYIYLKTGQENVAEAISKAIIVYLESGKEFFRNPITE